MSTKSPVG